MMRVLVTGSRDWDDEATIIGALWGVRDDIGDFTLVHGAARGADSIAAAAARRAGMTVEAHPADWTRYGKRAGYVRNAEMVSLGADVCLAFIRNNSRGASMCADLAEKAGIRTVRFREGAK